jgi:undecaprenyl-diphosphatase
MSLVQAIILAIIEGITEFLPISSTGHMIIGSTAMGIAADPFVKAFTIAIQFGAITSVIVLYWKRFWQSLKFYYVLALAFVPAAIIGFLLNDVIDVLLERVDVVGWMLIAGGVVLLFVDKFFERTVEHGSSAVSYPRGLKIGLFQCLALIPGVSRAAATIIGGLAVGLNRRTAAEFSFFLAIPTMLAATVYKLGKFYLDGNTFGEDQWMLLAVGNIIAFLVAMAAIKLFIGYLTRHGFRIFGYYRIAVGLIILILYYFGADIQML